MRKNEILFENVDKNIVIKYLLFEEESHFKKIDNYSNLLNSNENFCSESTKEIDLNGNEVKLEEKELLNIRKERFSKFDFYCNSKNINQEINPLKKNSIKNINTEKRNMAKKNKNLSTITESSYHQNNKSEFGLEFQKELFYRENDFFSKENLNFINRENEERKYIGFNIYNNPNDDVPFFKEEGKYFTNCYFSFPKIKE